MSATISRDQENPPHLCNLRFLFPVEHVDLHRDAALLGDRDGGVEVGHLPHRQRGQAVDEGGRIGRTVQGEHQGAIQGYV